MEIKIKLLPGGRIPTRGSDEAAGYDIYLKEDDVIMPFDPMVIKTGVCVKIPENNWLDVSGRSSTFAKRGLLVVIGHVDPDYIGEVGIQVLNVTDHEVKVYKGERLAQFLLKGHNSGDPVEFVEVDELDETERGSGGFGSTGT